MASDIALAKDKVQTYLRDLVGRFEVDKDGDFTFRHGSSRIFISVEPISDDNTYVEIYSPLASDVPASPGLFEYVATQNTYRFGKLLAVKQPDGAIRIVMTYGMLGDYLDPEELKVAVSLLAGTADEIDNKICDQFGGTVFHAD